MTEERFNCFSGRTLFIIRRKKRETRGQIIAKLLGSGNCHHSVDNKHNIQ